MIEQSKLNGPLYHSKLNEKSVAVRQINIPDVQFGPPRKITIHKNPSSEKLLVEDVESNIGYIYGTTFEKEVEPITYTNDILYNYYCGVAIFEEQKCVYWIKNTPPVTISDDVDLQTLTLPASLTGYPYAETFTFKDDIIDLLGDITATYVDRYKRPINADAIENDVYLPIGIDKVTHKFKDIVNKHTHFPIVCQLTGTPFGVLDLEPGYTEDEHQQAESFPYIYKETTPRGGVHYLFRTDSDAFKYRVSDNLEIIVNAMVTFYGGGQVFQNDEIVTEDQFSDYKELGHTTIEVTTSTKDVSDIVDKLYERNQQEDALGFKLIAEQYRTDKDLSHADYMSMIHLLQYNIGPYLISLKRDYHYTDDDIPWIMAEYLSRLIEFRLKHHREIVGVPYLVYVATKVYQRRRG